MEKVSNHILNRTLRDLDSHDCRLRNEECIVCRPALMARELLAYRAADGTVVQQASEIRKNLQLPLDNPQTHH